MDVCVIFADVNEDDVRAHGGSELQIADSEAITSTVLLREMHAQMHEAAVRAGRPGAPPLTIVTQVRPLETGLPAFAHAHSTPPPQTIQIAHSLQAGWLSPIRPPGI